MPADQNKALKDQTVALKGSLHEYGIQVQDLQRSLQHSRNATNKLNKELNENHINYEKEKKKLMKTFKSEIKSWRKSLGSERSARIKAERKLAMAENYVEIIASRNMKYDSCQTDSSLDVPYAITDALPPIFGSQLCQTSKSISYTSSLPNLST